MKVLGIETSCDETAVAIVDDNKKIISNLIISQIDLHKEFGGVVPEIAARSHADVLDQMIQKSLADSKLSFQDLDAIAVTAGPGLIGGVIVGLTMAKTLASFHKKPFIAVNHLEAHALTIRLDNKDSNPVSFPYLLLLVSGGHCQILLTLGVGKYHKIGETIDDALGEAFDKVAQMLGLEYPGGPKIEKLAKNGSPDRYKLPKPLFGTREHNCNFSFSGLKTAVRRLVENLTGEEYDHFSSAKKLNSEQIADICASFQKTVAEILVNRLKNSLEVIADKKISIEDLVIAGGVAANQYLYQKITEFGEGCGLRVLAPSIKICTDNAAMVAWVGIEKLKLGLINELDFAPRAKWSLVESQKL
ncbi:MAG: N6-L-threonylcarbamoyladenine synthase [Rickettsiales bacterium]|jgi:N6-L-threonylcarbamoyladenine synthase